MSNLKDILNSFRLKEELNPEFWDKKGKQYILKRDIRDRLLEIANEFFEFLNVDVIISDVTFTGSLSNFNWSKFSDIDLHLIADYKQFKEKELPLYQEFFLLKKTIFNDKHDIKIKGYEVELYIQDENEEHTSTGVYSLLHNKWLVEPKISDEGYSKKEVEKKAKQWMDIIDGVLENVSDEPIQKAKEILKKYKEKIKKYRKCGLEKGGEYSIENLVFKTLRRNGYIEKLYNFSTKILDKKLSLNEANTKVGGVFNVDLENGPSNHSKRALGNWQSDNAWDLFAPAGTVVNSYTNGIVSRVNESSKKYGKVFGTQVTIKGEDGYPDIFYTHLKNVKLSKGQKVKVGDYIGEVTEWCKDKSCRELHAGTHVHIGLPRGNSLKDLINKSDNIFTGKKNDSANQDDKPSIDDETKKVLSKGEKISDEDFQKILGKISESKFLTDFFEGITDSTNLKNQSGTGTISFDETVEKAQKGLQFLGFSLPKWGVDGKFGDETEQAVRSFEKELGLNEDGVLDSGDLKVLISALAMKGFDDTKLSGIQMDSDMVVNGKVDFSNGNFSAEQIKNINLMIDEMNKQGITNPYTQVGILSVIGKESNFRSFAEHGYEKTSNDRIRSIFGKRATRYSDSELTQLKKDYKAFFEAMYGVNSGTRLGNTQPGDGWRYVGRGFNGITGRGNYKKYGNIVGMDLESNPEMLENPQIAAKAAVAFFTKGKSPKNFPNFTNKEDAAIYFADINAGGGASSHRDNALKSGKRFDVIA